jgi:hypothetical protein
MTSSACNDRVREETELDRPTGRCECVKNTNIESVC